ncbi:hypothetical protein AVEN_211718-1 [Araneus ventricosus]|uniref:Uncharacterized protein n=1 Tax=Araneus ventricosus TaxID=182803 RepID=A0A4Y2M925_ARAVE|nr:hypothetical protein AVEN_211718-1 [Araneus ventricosus]
MAYKECDEDYACKLLTDWEYKRQREDNVWPPYSAATDAMPFLSNRWSLSSCLYFLSQHYNSGCNATNSHAPLNYTYLHKSFSGLTSPHCCCHEFTKDVLE